MEDDDEEEEDPTLHLLGAIASLLESLVCRSERLLLPGSEHAALHAFRAARPPGIGIGGYLERIHRLTRCSPACFVVAFVYVDRLMHRHPHALLLSLNVHRLVLASVLVASKVLEDVHYDNAFFAKVGGVSNEELNRLELELLFLLDFGVVVSSSVFENYCMHLEKHMMLKGCKVDWSVLDMGSNGGVDVLKG